MANMRFIVFLGASVFAYFISYVVCKYGPNLESYCKTEGGLYSGEFIQNTCPFIGTVPCFGAFGNCLSEKGVNFTRVFIECAKLLHDDRLLDFPYFVESACPKNESKTIYLRAIKVLCCGKYRIIANTPGLQTYEDLYNFEKPCYDQACKPM